MVLFGSTYSTKLQFPNESAREGLGLGEAWLTKGVGLGVFNAAARGAGVGDDEPPVEIG